MTHDLHATMKERITATLRNILGQRKEAIRERLLSCLADHVEQELNDFAEPPALDDALFAAGSQTGEAPQPQHATATPVPSSPEDLSHLLRETQRLTRCNDQVSILECLIEGAARFSGRSVVFVCRNGQAMGWEQSGFAANPYSMAIRGAVLPLSEESVLSRVVSSGEAMSSDDAGLADPLWKAIGTDPSPRFTAVPLTVRGRIAAILFADAGTSEDRQALQADGLAILARMAEMSLETMTLRAEQGQAQSAAAEQQQQAAAPAQAVEPQASMAPAVETTAPPAPPVVMAPPHELPEQAHEAAPDEAPDAALEKPHEQNAHEDSAAATEEAQELEDEAMEVAPHHQAPAAVQGAVAPQETVDAPVGEAAAAPSEPPAPAPDSEEERLHEQARRFARLLISEILLYNPDQVQEGKQQHDLADRLKDDLGRSEEMYRQRVAPHVAAETNYFHEEVVRTLADGDPAVLGT